MLFDLAVHGWTRVFRHFAGDCYLFLSVGRNFAERGVFTMDHVHPTNGFHPLWQIFVGVLYRVGNALSLDEPTILVLVALTNLLCIAAAIWLICRSYLLARGRLPASFLFLPVGVYGLLAAPLPTALGPRGTLWGFVNGMESSFSLFIYGLFLLVLVRRDFANARSALLLGVLLAGVFLARLDSIFLAVAACLVLGVRAVVRRDPASLRQGVLVGLPVLVVLGCYLAINLATVGLALPVSALAKSTAPNLSKLGEIAEALSGQFPFFRDWRLAQILFPMAVAVVALVHHRGAWVRKRMTPVERMFVTTAVFVLLLGLYNFLVVPTLDQGHWYFPISILFTSLFIFHLFDLSPRFALLDSKSAGVAFALATVLVFRQLYSGGEHFGALYRNFVTHEVPLLKRHYRPEEPRILSFDDGIVAYGTGWPVMTWRGFMLDAESIEYCRRPELSLLELAYRRGFDRLTAVRYFYGKGLQPGSPSPMIRAYLLRWIGIPPQELDRFDYSIDYLSRSRGFFVIRMHPRLFSLEK
jgi:hypothetical protein